MRIILLGLPGAGKGTQAQKLHTKTGIPLIVMGDILRDAIERKTPIGQQAEKYVSQGSLVPDEVVIQIVNVRLQQEDCAKKGFLLDGFPRTIEQALALEKAMAAHKIKSDYVLYYKLADEVAIQRSSGRLVCKQCKAIYHLTSKSPKKADTCDACGTKLAQRKDDAPEVIRKRLAIYHKETAPLLDYYRQQQLLLEILADRSEEEIFTDTLTKLRIQ